MFAKLLCSVVIIFFYIGWFQKIDAIADENGKFLCSAERMTQLDLVTARVISLDPKTQRKFPVTPEEIPPYCAETKKDINFSFDTVQKCFTGSSKQFGTILAYSVRKTVNTLCSPKARKQHALLLDMGRCVSKSERPLRKCLTTFMDVLHRGKLAKRPGDRMGYACCHYWKLLGCMSTINRAKCTAKEASSIEEFIRNIFDSLINVSCGDFVEASDRCDSLPVAPKRRKVDKDTKTFFLPLVELWNHLI